MAIITDANLKAHLGITGTQHDTIITNAANAANQAVVQFCGRTFDTTTVGSETARVYRPENRCLVLTDDFHDTTNLVVKTDEGDDGTYETTWTIDDDFQTEPLNQLENGVTVPYYRIVAVESRLFPTTNRRPSVQVTAAWGWASVPGAVFEAALIKAARLFHRKDSPQGVAGFNEFGAVKLSSRDDDIMSLLAPFRRSEQILLVG